MVFDEDTDDELVSCPKGTEGDAKRDYIITAHGLTPKVDGSAVEVQQMLLPEPEPDPGSDVSEVKGSGGHFFRQLQWEEQGGILQRLLQQHFPALVTGVIVVTALIIVTWVSLSGPAEKSVDTMMTVKGVDYKLLVADDALHRRFVSQLKSALWASTRVPEDDIEITIMQGSVRVHARLRTPEDVDPVDFVNDFPSSDVTATVASAVKSTSNIQSCLVGPIDVDGISVDTFIDLPAPPDDAYREPQGFDLAAEDPTVTPTTLPLAAENSTVTSVKESGGDLAFKDNTSQVAETGARAASTAASAAPYDARETIDLPTDENTKLLVSSMEKKFQRCALIGASPMLKGKGHGQDIDSFDVVIRVNRVPTDEYYEDFGQRTDIFYGNALEMYSGEVTLMGNGDDVTKRRCGPALCDYLGIVFRGDYGCDFGKLQRNWGEDFVLGCTTRNVSKAAYGFQLLESVEPTSGFMAFLTFAPLCREMVLYGFSGHGAIDGHTEWKGHSLDHEHRLLRWIEGGDWGKIELPESRDWLQNHLPSGQDGLPAVHVVQN